MEPDKCECGPECQCGPEGDCEKESCCINWLKNPKKMILVLGMVLVTIIVVTSILRDRWVNRMENQVTVTGQGKALYQPDVANATLGVQISRVSTAEEALRQLNEKMTRIVEAIKTVGIPAEDIQTQTYNLYPNYDYIEGRSVSSGYNVSQQLVVKVRNLAANPELTSKVLEEGSRAGVNQIVGVSFDISDLSDAKHQARLKAIADAKSRAQETAKAVGIHKLGKVTSWYENVVTGGNDDGRYYGGIGGEMSAKPAATPQLPAGSQEITMEVGITYEVK